MTAPVSTVALISTTERADEAFRGVMTIVFFLLTIVAFERPMLVFQGFLLVWGAMWVVAIGLFAWLMVSGMFRREA